MYIQTHVLKFNEIVKDNNKNFKLTKDESNKFHEIVKNDNKDFEFIKGKTHIII